MAADRMLSDWIVLSEPEIQLMDDLETRLPRIPANPSIVLVTVQPGTTTRFKTSAPAVGFPRRAYADILGHVVKLRPSVVILDVDLSSATPEDVLALDQAISEDPTVAVVVPAVPAKRVHEDEYVEDEALVSASALGGVAISYAPLPLRPRPNLHIGNAENYPGHVSTGTVPYRTDHTTGQPILHVTALAVALFSKADLAKTELTPDRTTFRIGHLQWELGGDQDLATRHADKPNAFPEFSFGQTMTHKPGPYNPFAGKIVLIGDVRPGIDRHETPPFGSQPGVRFLAHTLNTLLMPAKYVARWVPEGVQNATGAAFGILAAYACFASRKWVRLLAPVVLALTGWFLPSVLIQTYALRFDPLILPVSVTVSALGCWLVLALKAGFVDVRKPGDVQIATVLFVDVKGSTELTRDIGGRSYQRAVSRFIAACAKDVSSAGGRLERSTGDGFVATFPNTGRSNSALACLSVIPKVRRHADRASEDVGRPFRIKAGLENGPVTGGYVPEQGRQSWSTAGNTINFAARLLDACSTFDRDLAVGPVAAAMLVEDVRLVPLGEFKPRGFDGPVTVYSDDDTDSPSG